MPRATRASAEQIKLFVETWTNSNNIQQISQTLKDDWRWGGEFRPPRNRSHSPAAIRQFESMLRSHGVNLPHRSNALPIEPATLNKLIDELT